MNNNNQTALVAASSQMPTRCYLYRFSSVPGKNGIRQMLLNSLRNSTLYLRKPGEFNDPFDSRSFIDEQITGKEWQELIEIIRLRPSSPFKPLFSRQKSQPNNIGAIIRQKTDELLADIGVCCFSETWQPIPMWSYYANHHKGVCFKYKADISAIPKGLVLLPINYCSNYPQLRVANLIFDLGTSLNHILTTKSLEWQHEREWRLISAGQGNITIPSPLELEAVYFGCRVDKTDKTDIKDALTNHSQVKFWQARTSDRAFALDFNPD